MDDQEGIVSKPSSAATQAQEWTEEHVASEIRNSPNPAFDLAKAHNAAMSQARQEKEKEWTKERIHSYDISYPGWSQKLADDINAAIAAEQGTIAAHEQSIKSLIRDLAAEREKADWLWSVIKRIEGGESLCGQLAAMRLDKR